GSDRGRRPPWAEPLRHRRNRRTGARPLSHPRGSGPLLAAAPPARLGVPARPEVAAVVHRAAGAAEARMTPEKHLLDPIGMGPGFRTRVMRQTTCHMKVAPG